MSVRSLRVLAAAVVLFFPVLHLGLHEVSEAVVTGAPVWSAAPAGSSAAVHDHAPDCPICCQHLSETFHLAPTSFESATDSSCFFTVPEEGSYVSSRLLDVNQPRAPPARSSVLL